MSDDRTTKAKLRDAAIELVAEGGVRAVTARGVADRAGVTQGLIRHHFGSMARLIAACDEHVAHVVRDGKEAALAQGIGFDALAAVRAAGQGHIMGYLAMRLGDDSPGIHALVDQMIADAVGYLGEGVERGLIAPTDDERARAALLTVFALGSLVLHRHLDRHFDLDLRAADLAQQPGFARYLRVQMEIFAGLLNPAIREQYLHVLDQLEDSDDQPDHH